MLARLRLLLELIRFSHTIFALPFALLSAVLAWRDQPFRWQDLLGILLCMLFARSAAMAFNRLVDREIDAQNPRTQSRHLPAGLISVRTVFFFTLLTSVAFIVSTLLFLPNRWPLYLSVPVLLFLLGYSFAKRFTIWCHYWLSFALMLSPLAAWIAIRGSLSTEPLLLGLVVFFWVGGFDIIYACQDVHFDQEKRLSSIPSRWGIKKALRFAMLSHFMTLVCLFGLWYVAGLGIPFLIGILAVSCLLIYEHLLVNPENLNRVNLAFFHVNAVISIGLFFVGLIDVWLA